MGSPEAALAALDAFKVKVDLTGTDLRDALDDAADLLYEALPRRGPPRPLVVVLLSDGDLHSPYRSHIMARNAARRLAQEGVRVHVLAFGKKALRS